MTRHSQPLGPPETPGAGRAHIPTRQASRAAQNAGLPVRLLTTKAVAEMLSVPEGTIRYWRKMGAGPPWVKLEGTIRYDLTDVESYIERCRHTPSVRARVEEKRVSL